MKQTKNCKGLTVADLLTKGREYEALEGSHVSLGATATTNIDFIKKTRSCGKVACEGGGGWQQGTLEKLCRKTRVGTQSSDEQPRPEAKSKSMYHKGPKKGPWKRFFLKNKKTNKCHMMKSRCMKNMMSNIPKYLLSSLSATICHLGETEDQHDRRLHQFFRVAQKEGLMLNSENCTVKTQHITFFGRWHTKKEVFQTPRKLTAF